MTSARARQALGMLDSAVSQLSVTRDVHVKLQQAVDDLNAFIAHADALEPSAAVAAAPAAP